jgi:hypothetical protein
MSPNGFQRAALAATLGLAVWAGLARAAGPTGRYHPGQTDAPPGVTVPQEGASHFWDWCRKCNLGCWSSFNGYGVGSLHSDAAFIFGSSRTFFGEPCLAGPPPSPLPPWVNLGTPGAKGGPPVPDPWGPNSPWAPGGIGGVPPQHPPAYPPQARPSLPANMPGQEGVPGQTMSRSRPEGAAGQEGIAWPGPELVPPEVQANPDGMELPEAPPPRRRFWRLRRWFR